VRQALLGFLVALALVVAGCGSSAKSSVPSQLVSPADFAAAVAQPGTVTINVLGPGAPMIPGTDLAIPADELTSATSQLPPLSTKLAVYCLHGNTSAVAVKTLAALGYEHIVELRGGMAAWVASGRQLAAGTG
jgi:phage shock protein E